MAEFLKLITNLQYNTDFLLYLDAQDRHFSTKYKI